MKIDEAIELLQKDIDDPGSVPFEELLVAKVIGIFALKRVKANRSGGRVIIWALLPGETKE